MAEEHNTVTVNKSEAYIEEGRRGNISTVTAARVRDTSTQSTI